MSFVFIDSIPYYIKVPFLQFILKHKGRYFK